MNAPEEPGYTADVLADPNIDAATLGRLAGSRPDLWEAILAHPNCYPTLTDWIRQQQNSGVAPQVVAGATPYVQYPVSGYYGQPTGGPDVVAGRHFVMPIAAFVAIISLFMPLVTMRGFGMSVSANYFTNGASPDGIFLILTLLAALVFGVVAYATKKKGLRITAGVIGIVAGFIGLLDGLINIGNASGLPYASVGVGAILLTLASIVVLAFAIVTLVPVKRR